MAATRIRIHFQSVDVVRDQDLIGPGEWFFNATIRRLPADDSVTVSTDTRYEAREGETIEMNWSHELEIETADQNIEIRLQGTDEDLIYDDDLGSILVRLNMPVVHDYDLRLQSTEECFVGRIRVEILARTSDSTGTVTTIREHFDSSDYTTLHDEMLSKMVHICPVIPVPWTHGIPPIPSGTQALSASPQVNLSINAASAGLNALVNPSLIPVIEPTDSDFAERCARIRVTQYRPADLDLSQLIWKAVTSNVRFWHGGASQSEVRGGQEVNAYGILTGDDDEECTIEVRWNSEGEPLLASYRAWIGNIKYIWCRANIIKCSSATVGGVPIQNPTYTAADIVSHLEFSNKILWQSGIQVVFDTDETTHHDDATLLQRGIFEINSATNYTFNVTKDRRIVAPLLNSRDNVFNLAYLHSCRGKPNLLGSATDRRLSEDEDTVSLSGTPSTSWIRPTGMWPDDASQTVEMTRMGPSTARDADQTDLCGDGAIDRICACLLTENCKANIANGEVTLPHELGHVIGLHHRGCGTPIGTGSRDGVNHMAGPRNGHGHPWRENLMSYGTDREAQDMDMLQIMVIRGHALLHDAPPAEPAPPPPPPPVRQEIPAEWTPTEADVILMQEYLCNKRPGLIHTGYDLGNYGPDGDGVDGDYGSMTRAAVRSFQRDHGGLQVDGTYGPNTRNAFDEEINGSSA